MDGAHALALLNDEILRGAFETLKHTYSLKLFNTTVDQPEAREKLYLAFRVVTEVERHLQAIADNGKLADAELSHLIAATEAKKKWQDVR